MEVGCGRSNPIVWLDYWNYLGKVQAALKKENGIAEGESSYRLLYNDGLWVDLNLEIIYTSTCFGSRLSYIPTKVQCLENHNT